MRLARRWGWRCSPPSRPVRPPGAGSRPATGTGSPSRRASPPGSRFLPCWPSRPCGPRPAPGWRCTEMAAQRAADHQRAIAERNVEAILDAVEELLQAAVERAVRRTMAALQAASPDDGPPVQALERMLAAAWRHLARYSAMAEAVAEHMSAEAVTRTHQAAHRTIGALLERGRADGSFRADLPAPWLATACIALIHACAEEVRVGRIGEHDAVRVLTVTVRDLCTGTAQA